MKEFEFLGELTLSVIFHFELGFLNWIITTN